MIVLSVFSMSGRWGMPGYGPLSRALTIVHLPIVRVSSSLRDFRACGASDNVEPEPAATTVKSIAPTTHPARK